VDELYTPLIPFFAVDIGDRQAASRDAEDEDEN
jgi:hypothetical protein